MEKVVDSFFYIVRTGDALPNILKFLDYIGYPISHGIRSKINPGFMFKTQLLLKFFYAFGPRKKNQMYA